MSVETAELRTTDGYVVESPHGDVGCVEEIWLDGGRPRGLAVRLEDGRRALLRERDVLTVDREHHWVVVPDDARLLELAVPRLESDGARLSNSWATTGEVVPAFTPPPPKKRASLRRAAPRAAVERPLWQLVLILYAGLVVIVATVIALAFAVPLLF
jgi:hypothetical protein